MQQQLVDLKAFLVKRKIALRDWVLGTGYTSLTAIINAGYDIATVADELRGILEGMMDKPSDTKTIPEPLPSVLATTEVPPPVLEVLEEIEKPVPPMVAAELLPKPKKTPGRKPKNAESKDEEK